MNRRSNEKLTNISRVLRSNMTKEERHLWYDFFKKIPYVTKRQKVIKNYVVDFFCPKASLVIELDGSQHYEVDGENKDILRDNALADLGIKVLRYSNYEVNSNFDGVCQDILRNIKEIIESDI